ncbi:hypothetical protein [aff. Roholtiella sp. LEGE 12411]|nr:hypothetical protein [aff. Roholtiella sp. LEGE 12411]
MADLLEGLPTPYWQLCQDQAMQLPTKTRYFKDWAQHLTDYAQKYCKN